MSTTRIHPSEDNEEGNRQNGDVYKQNNNTIGVEEDESNLKCKFGPKACLNIKWVVFWLCVIGFIEGAAVNGVTNIVLTTLERRFSLPSSQSALIVSSTDIGAVIFVLFVSFFGAKKNRAVIVGIGTLIMALGSFIFLIPHFATDPYNYKGASNDASKQICSVNSTDTCQAPTASGSGFLYVFMLAQFVHGIGFTPMFTLGTAYVDDNAKSESTAIYLGLIYALTALGVAAGYMGGGQFLSLWVDFERVDTSFIEENNYTPMDPIWVGAWWVGFVITSATFFLSAIPMFAYPKNLPGTAAIRAARLTEEDKIRIEKQKNDSRPIKQKILDFPKAIWILIRIPCYVIINLAACAETLIIGGLAAFAPKVLEEKFDVLPSDAGLIMGAVTLLGGAGGMVLGGILIKCFKLQVRGMTRLCSIMAIVSLAIGAGFFINCDAKPFAGLSTAYKGGSISSIESTCNIDCGCSTSKFDPICGSDSVTYFSPCHAGCLTNTTNGFGNCGCIGVNQNGTATAGECGGSCNIYILFIVLLFLAMLCTFTTVTPASMAILRCVPDEHRAVGLGLQWVLLRLLGTIPGPVLTGSVLDTSCDVWQDTCGTRGSCWIYDRIDMSWKLFTWWCAVKLVSSAAFFIGGKFYKTPALLEKTMTVNGKSKPNLIPNGDYDVNFGKKSFDNSAFVQDKTSSSDDSTIVVSTHI